MAIDALDRFRVARWSSDIVSTLQDKLGIAFMRKDSTASSGRREMTENANILFCSHKIVYYLPKVDNFFWVVYSQINCIIS